MAHRMEPHTMPMSSRCTGIHSQVLALSQHAIFESLQQFFHIIIICHKLLLLAPTNCNSKIAVYFLSCKNGAFTNSWRQRCLALL